MHSATIHEKDLQVGIMADPQDHPTSHCSIALSAQPSSHVRFQNVHHMKLSAAEGLRIVSTSFWGTICGRIQLLQLLSCHLPKHIPVPARSMLEVFHQPEKREGSSHHCSGWTR